MSRYILVFMLLIISMHYGLAQQLYYKGGREALQFVDKNPRVAIYDLSVLESAVAMDMRVVGVSKGALPPSLVFLSADSGVVDIGGLKGPNLSALEALAPDLIIISGRQRKLLDSMSAIAPVLDMSLDSREYLIGIGAQVDLLGRICGCEDKADLLLSGFRDGIMALQKAARAVNGHDALMLMYVNGQYVGYAPSSRFGYVYDVLGFQASRLPIDDERRFQRVSAEEILAADPDYLFIFNRSDLGGDKYSGRAAIENELIQQTRAFKQGNIVYLTPALWYLVGGGVFSSIKMGQEALRLSEEF